MYVYHTKSLNNKLGESKNVYRYALKQLKSMGFILQGFPAVQICMVYTFSKQSINICKLLLS